MVIGSGHQSVFPMNVVSGKHAPCSCHYSNLADSAGLRIADLSLAPVTAAIAEFRQGI